MCDCAKYFMLDCFTSCRFLFQTKVLRRLHRSLTRRCRDVEKGAEIGAPF